MKSEVIQYLIFYGIPLSLACVMNLIMVLCWKGKIARLMLARVMLIANALAFVIAYLWAFLRARNLSSSGWGFEGAAAYLGAIGLMLLLLVAFLIIGSWVLREIRQTRDTKGYAFVMDFSIATVLLAVSVVVMKRLMGDG